MMRALSALILSAAPSFGAPLALEIPPEIVPTGQYVRFTPKTDAVSIVYVGLDGIDPFPSEDLKDPRRFLLDTRGLANTRLRFVAVAAGKDGEQAWRGFTVVIGTAPPPPGPPGPGPIPPGPTPPPVPPEPPPGPSEIWLVIVEETGQAARNRLAMLSNPAIAKAMSAAGNHWRVVDKDVKGADGRTPADIDRFVNDAAMKDVPRFYLVDAGGRARFVGKLADKTPEEVAALITKYSGR